MSYSAGEALILTQVQACASFDTTNTSRANWKLLNQGKSGRYAILAMGEFEHISHGMGGTYQTRWETLCEVWCRYIDDSSSLTTLEGLTQEIVDRFDAYRKAQDTTGLIQDVMVRRAARPTERWKTGANGPAWLMQELSIVWLEQSTVTLQE